MTINGLDSVFGASGHVAASGRKERRDGELIGTQQGQHRGFWCVESHLNLLPLSFLKGLFDGLKGGGNLSLYNLELCFEQRDLRINHHIGRRLIRRQIQPYRLSQPALQAITLHGAAESFSYCESNTQTAGTRFSLLKEVKNGQMRREMPSALLVNPFKVRVP